MKQCKDLRLVSFNKALRWVKAQNPTEAEPVYVNKYGGRSNLPFRVWAFSNALLIMSNEHANHQAQYILDQNKWVSFIKFVRANPEMKMGVLAKEFRRFSCSNKIFWPVVISISKAVHEDNQ